jgi:FAD/FMN-containing dehydrogenase
VGGCVAAGLSGPRRASVGALRDFVLGVKLIDGRAAADMGASFRVVLLPGLDDLGARATEGRGYWEPWLEELRARGVAVFDATSALLAPGLPLAGLYAPHGHYGVEGNRLVGEGLARALDAGSR